MPDPARRSRDVEVRRECAVCGQPDVYPRCDHREFVDRKYVALDAVVDLLREQGDPTMAGGYHDAALVLEEGFADA